MEIAMTPAELRSKLKTGPMTVTFRKADGSIRKMTCTMDMQAVPEASRPSGSATVKEDASNSKLFKVYDLDKAGWRSFKFDTLIQEE